MILTIMLAIGAMGIFALFLSLGLIFKGKPLQGTCASQSAALAADGITCGVCGKAVGSCENTDLDKISAAK
ncbi:MAG: hypothetical protein NW226_05560 [Microscillaceae bacterium]|nr:hypothetical protein [Microscillaceae bacterium]